MPQLTGKGSTLKEKKLSASVKSSLLADKKKKPGLLTSLVSKIRGVGAKAHQLTQTEEAKALKYTATHPLQVIKSGLKETSEATGRAGESLIKAGEQAEKSKLPIISQAGSITRAAGGILSGPESTRQNIIRIGDDVKKGKITMADGIIEATSSVGLQGVSLIAAPFLTAINSGLNISGLDKPLEEGIEGGTNFLINLTSDTFGISKDKAESRVNSALNIARGLGLWKGGKIINKGGVKNFVTGSAVMSSPDLTLTVLAFGAKEEGKKLPTPNILKGIAANAVIIPIPFGKIPKAPKVTPPKITPKVPKVIPPKITPKVPKVIPPKITPKAPKVDLKKITLPKVPKVDLKKVTLPKEPKVDLKKVTLPKEPKVDLKKVFDEVLKPKEKITEPKKDILKIAETTVQKKNISNNLRELSGLQDIKAMEANIRDGIMTKEQAVIRKTELVDALIKDGLLKESGVDKQGKSFLFTDKAKTDFNIGGKKSSLPFLKEGVHLPVEKVIPPKKIILPKEPKVIPPKITPKVDLKKVVDDIPIIKKEKVLKEKKAFVEKDIKKPGLIDYFGKEEFKDLKPHLNIVARRFRKTGEATVSGRLQDVIKQTANTALDLGKSLKDTALSTIGGFLDAVATVDQSGRKQTLGDLMGGIKGRLNSTRDKTSKILNIDTMNDFLGKNVKSIDAGYKFLKSQNLKELIPGTDIPARMRRFFIEKAQNANELYAKNLGEKQNFANKLAVVAQYVGGEVASRIRKMKQFQIDEIKERKNISDEVKNSLINEIKISKDDITRIQSDIISSMPRESQKFLNDYFNLYGQFQADTILKKGFETIGKELNDKGILKSLRDDFSHGYVPDEILREYIRVSGDSMGFSKQDISSFLKEGVPLSPEQRSSILKRSNDVWFLHSQDPASIAHSYLNEVTELVHHKMIDDILNTVSDKNPEVANYLKGMKDQNSKIYNDVKEISRPKNVVVRAVDKYLNASAYGLYILNPTLIAQNAFTSGVYGLGKAFSNLTTGKGSYGKDVFTIKNRNPTAEFLFNKGLLSHRDIDANIGFKGDATILEKTVRNVKKYVWEQPMQKSTALGVKTIQVITANAFMKKFVGADLRQGETIVDAYKRKLDALPPAEKLKAETELYRQVSSIENPTHLNRATNAMFDVKLFGMVTAWARGNSSFIFNKTMDVVDTIHHNLRAKAKEKGYTTIKDGNSIDNMTMVTTKVVLAYAAAKLLGELLYDDDDDRQDEVKKRLNAASLKDNMLYFLTHSTGLAGLSIGSRNLGFLTDFAIQLGDAYENGDEEAAQKAMGEFVDRWFSGIKKFKDALIGDKTQTTRGGEFKYQDIYGDETLGDAIGRIMGLSKPAAEYSQTYDRLVEMERDLKRQSPEFNVWGDMFDQLKRHLPSLPTSSKDIQNVKFRLKVDRMNRNIRDLGLKKVGFNDWIDNAYEGIEAPSEARELARTNLGEQFPKNAQTNLKTIGKLQHVVKEIEAVKGVQVFPNDFGRTLESLKKTHPKLYNKFMKQVYGTISAEGITPEIREANAKFIDTVISADLGGEMLATNISGLVRRVAGLDVDLKRQAGLIISDKDKLASLEKVIETLQDAPMLQEQILSSLSELVNVNITKENAQNIFDSIKEYPIISQLYRRAAELRGAILIDDVDKGVEKTEEPSKIAEEGKLSDTIPTKGTDTGTLPQSSEKKKKLIDLIDLETEETPPPQVTGVKLQTLLDKVI